MKKIILSLVVLASSIFAVQAQNNMIIHQGNGSTLSLPLQSIDSVRFNLVPPPAMKRIFQNNGNILSLSVADIDSITYTIPNRSTLPTLTTQAVTVLSSSSAFGGGNISADGGSAVTQRGVCWNTSPNPTLANNFTVDGTGLGSYGSTMQPLSPATTYYVRAYATNANGTSYGSQVSFVTAAANSNGNMPTISTNQVVYMDSLSAFCGGNITADGGLAVTARGVCWAIGTTPTINNSRTLDGVGGGNFNSRLPNLLPNTTYFVRAYATNAAGTAYGISFGFTTKGYATVVTDSVYDIMALSARAAGSVLSDGGIPETERGFCWSYSPNPSVDDNKVLAGNGLGAFAQQIQSLAADTLVYVRAFAGSSIGFSYGNQISFKTQTGIVDVINPSTGKIWMDRNLGATQTATSSTDSNSYGDLYQWGRSADGHQNRTSPTTATLSSVDKPAHGDFILSFDWRSTQNDSLWQGVNGVNNPCPRGYRLPTSAELNAERSSWSQNNSAGAFASPLKFPVAGSRYYNIGWLGNVGVFGFYWSSTVNSTLAQGLSFDSSNAGTSNLRRGLGISVRCIKD
jgi:hypothetical protein